MSFQESNKEEAQDDAVATQAFSNEVGRSSVEEKLISASEPIQPKSSPNALRRLDDNENHQHSTPTSKPSESKEEDHESGTTSNTTVTNGEATAAEEEEEEEEFVALEGEAEVSLNINTGQETDVVKPDEAESPGCVAPAKCNSDDDENEDEENNSSNSTTQDIKDDDQFTSPLLKWYNPFRNFCGRIVNNERFQLGIVILIILNALFMGIATYDFVADSPSVKKAFEITDQVFLIIFTIECGLQIGYHGYKLFYDGWLAFDFFVVVLSWSVASMQVFRAFRCFRAFRLIARLEVLRELVNAIVAVLPRIGSIMLLFCLVLYIYSVLTTVLFGDHLYGDGLTNYFGRLDYSLFTLFQFVTLENWGQVSRDVMKIYPWAAHIFLSFLMISSFILYSLVVAVVCDAVAVIEHPDIALKKFEDKMKKETSKTKGRVKKLTMQLDELSTQQMEMLLAVQNNLMKFESFRKDAQESDAVSS